MARVHRIGQKKTVHIYRLVSQVDDPFLSYNLPMQPPFYATPLLHPPS